MITHDNQTPLKQSGGPRNSTGSPSLPSGFILDELPEGAVLLDDDPSQLPHGFVLDELPKGAVRLNGISEDIHGLRRAGEKDEDILETYRQIAPHHASDINELLKRGEKAKDILDTIASMHPSAPRPDPMEGQGVLEKGIKALQYGTANRAVGYGKTLDAVGVDSAGKAIVELGQSIAPNNYRPASSDFFNPQEKDKGLFGYGWSYAPRTLLEQVPGLAIDLGIGAATGGTGFIVSNASANFGPTVEARAAHSGRTLDEATLKDYAYGAGGTALNAYLNKVGVSPALSSSVKGVGMSAISQIPRAIAKAGVAEGVTEAAQTAVDQAATQYDTARGYNPISPENLREIVGSGALGVAGGASLRGARVPGDVINSVRYLDMEPASATRLAKRFETLEIESNDPKASFDAIEAAQGLIRRDAALAKAQALSELGRSNGEDAARDVGGMVDAAEATLEQGYVVSGERFQKLRETLGNTPEGLRLVEALEEHNTLNQLKAKGRYSDGYFAGGISSTPLIEDTINPTSWLKDRTKRTIGGATAALTLSEAPIALQAGLAPAALAKVLAAQSAAYGTARAVDAVAGSRNPLREFTNRFGEESGGEVDTLTRAASEAKRASRARERVTPQAIEAQAEGSGSQDAMEMLREAARKVTQAQKAVETTEGPQGDNKAAGESPRGSSESSHSDIIRINTRGYTIERPKAGIVNVGRYVAKARAHMGSRADLGDELESLVGSRHSNTVKALINKLNQQARSYREATEFAEEAINELPWDRRSKAFDVWLKHEPTIRSTYRD